MSTSAARLRSLPARGRLPVDGNRGLRQYAGHDLGDSRASVRSPEAGADDARVADGAACWAAGRWTRGCLPGQSRPPGRIWSEVAVNTVSSVPVIRARIRQQASSGKTMPSLASDPRSRSTALLAARWRAARGSTPARHDRGPARHRESRCRPVAGQYRPVPVRRQGSRLPLRQERTSTLSMSQWPGVASQPRPTSNYARWSPSAPAGPRRAA